MAHLGGKAGHEEEGGEGAKEDGKSGMTHGEDGGDEEGFITDFRDDDEGEGLYESFKDGVAVGGGSRWK